MGQACDGAIIYAFIVSLEETISLEAIGVADKTPGIAYQAVGVTRKISCHEPVNLPSKSPTDKTLNISRKAF
jgi:hypothetical protein